MFETLGRLREEHLVFLGLMATLMSIAATIVLGIVAVQMRKLRERQLELGFKNDLLRRGFSVDEAVRLLSSARPTWSQSLMSVGDWTIGRVSGACSSLAVGIRRLAEPCRRLLRTTWREGRQFLQMAARRGRVWGRIAWTRGSQLCRQAWHESRPALRWTMKSINEGVHWLGDQTDRLVRRLAPHRP